MVVVLVAVVSFFIELQAETETVVVGQITLHLCRRRREKQRNVEIDPALSAACSSRHLAPFTGNAHDFVIDDVTILDVAGSFQDCSVEKLNDGKVRRTLVYFHVSDVI